MDEVVIADWPKHCDERLLGEQLERLRSSVVAQEVERHRQGAAAAHGGGPGAAPTHEGGPGAA